MNFCMGAIADPNIVKIDTNYDSRVNLPDFGIFSFDYGYASDPNASSNNDPNCQRSDFNTDHRVDMEDLTVLAEHWLTVVMDEYRVCSLCNLYKDPNMPKAINADDMDAFMADWGKSSVTDCSVSFKDTQNSPVDPNWLSGVITVYVEDYRPSTWMFVQVDGSHMGEMYADGMPPTFEIPTYEFGNGNHTLMLGGYTSEGGCWMENVRVQFQNPLYFLSVPTTYEPNQPLCFSAFSSGEEVSVKVYADCGNLVWSQTYNGNDIWGSIPASITTNHTIDYVNFNSSSGASITKTTALEEPENRPADPDVKALMIMPDPKLFQMDPQIRYKVINAFYKKGINVKPLEGQSATYANVAKYAQAGHIKYIYILGHGVYKFGEGENEVLRTCIKLADGWVASCKHSEFTSPPSWCKPFPGNEEQWAKTWASMGFDRLVFVYSDACYGGRLKIDGTDNLIEGPSGAYGVTDFSQSDLTLMLGMGNTYESRAYHGWYDKGWLSYPGGQTSYQEWAKDVWLKMGEGKNLNEALNYAISETEDFSDGAAVNNYRLKGQGLLTDIRIKSY